MDDNPLQAALASRIGRLGPHSYTNLTDSNFLDNGFVLPPALLAEGFSAYLAERSYHPDAKGAVPARASIAAWYRRDAGDGAPWADPESILLTASSSESYNLLFQAFCEPGDSVLLPSPGYPLFEDLCRYNRLEPRFYPLNESSGWQPDLDILDSLADARTKFMVLISPNNPCGSVIGEAHLGRILDICRRHELMVISDEVFSAFLYQPGPLPRAAAVNASRHSGQQVPVFTINGISKLFACPDLKLSWIAVSGPATADSLPTTAEIVRELELRNDTFLNCNSLSQALLPSLFTQGGDFIRGMVAALAENRRLVLERLVPGLPPSSRLILPSGGIHFVLSFSRYQVDDDEVLALRLLERGLYLHPGYLYGIDDHPALVLSLLKERQAFERGIALLAESLAALV